MFKGIVILGLFVICQLLFNIPVFAAATTTTMLTTTPSGGARLQSNIGGLGIGYIRVGSDEVATLAWRPDFKFGPWGLGADINLYLGKSQNPPGCDNVVLRYVEYDDAKKGLRYGLLERVTVGHGLIMKNYTTRRGDQVLLNNEQMGAKAYLDLDSWAVRGMLTRSNIYYVRLEERLNPTLTLGQYYVADSTGRSIVQPGGTTKNFPAVAGAGLDATMPLPHNFEFFAEAGNLLNHGSGVTAGFSWSYDALVANSFFSAEYRFLDKGFVPGYFGADYENNPVDLNSAEASGKPKNGFLVQLGANALGLAALSVIYENYQDSNSSLMADLTAKAGDQIMAHGYYKQPNFVDYRSISLEQGAIIGADLAYKTNPYTSLILHYKQAYNPAAGKVESTQYVELGLSF